MAKLELSADEIAKLKQTLTDTSLPMSQRYRCIFTLKNIGGKDAIDALVSGLGDESALLKHEIAYVLGQMGDKYVVPVLEKLLLDVKEDYMVRHEAGEALGALGAFEAEKALRVGAQDQRVEVAETCQLALGRLEWERKHGRLEAGEAGTVDPAPPFQRSELNVPATAPSSEWVSALRTILLGNKSLFDRYRAMFSLRDEASIEAVEALSAGLSDQTSALFRHEIAYVLGQLQHPASADALSTALKNKEENDMVRHEAAEALGSLVTSEPNKKLEVLEGFLEDEATVVKESCEVATDMHHYHSSNEFQYADGLKK